MNYTQFGYPGYIPQASAAQQRLEQMQPGFVPYGMAGYASNAPMPNGFIPQPQRQDGMKITTIPVASEQEAMAVQTDFAGGMTVMVDPSHGAIYTKQLSPQTGASIFSKYLRQDAPPSAEQLANGGNALPKDQYVSRAEFDALKNSFEQLLTGLSSSTVSQNTFRTEKGEEQQ